MQTEKVAKEFYTIDSASTACVHMIRSFERDSDMPIAFIHYKHSAHAQNKKSYRRKNDFSTVFIFVRDGVGFLFGETLYTPSFGEAIVVPEQTPFSVFGTGDQFDYYEIDFPNGFANRIYEENPFTSLFKDKTHAPMLSLASEKKEAIFSLLQRAENADEDLLQYSYLIQLAHILNSEAADSAPTKRIPKTLASAIEYMNTHHAQIAGADEIAMHCGVSTTYLTRLFRTFLSCTTTEYLNRLRISHAKGLLLSGHSATEACYGAGFNCYTYFISKFKEETGITPAKFRAQNPT